MSDESDEREGAIGNLGTYLAEYLGTYSEGDGALNAPACEQMANAILWATGRQRWRPSQGAQEMMATETRDGDSEWEFIGIEDETGEVHEVSGGGVTRLTTVSGRQGPDPPVELQEWGDLVEPPPASSEGATDT